MRKLRLKDREAVHRKSGSTSRAWGRMWVSKEHRCFLPRARSGGRASQRGGLTLSCPQPLLPLSPFPLQGCQTKPPLSRLWLRAFFGDTWGQRRGPGVTGKPCCPAAACSLPTPHPPHRSPWGLPASQLPSPRTQEGLPGQSTVSRKQSMIRLSLCLPAPRLSVFPPVNQTGI